MAESTDMIFLNDILLPRDPQSNMHAATKQYVDNAVASKADATHNHTASEITGLGTAATVDTGTSAGNVPVIGTGGKLPDAILPALAITDVFTAESETAMLALSAQKGDVCIRTDLNKSFILGADNPATASSWKELLTPTDAVSSVNGETGAVLINAVPDGGTAGQALVKTSDGYEWQSTRYTGTITGDGSKKTWTVTHNLGEQDVLVDVSKSNGDDGWDKVYVSIVKTSANAININFAVAPAVGDTFKVIACR